VKGIFLAALFLLFVMIAPPTSATSDADYWYAYLVGRPGHELRYAVMNPLQLDKPLRYIPLGTTRYPGMLYKVASSPDAQWVALALGEPQVVTKISLLNTQTGEQGEIMQHYLLGARQELLGPAQDMAWSPDSHYLALDVHQEFEMHRYRSDIYTYDTVSGQMLDLTFDDFLNNRMVWSPDSTRMATVTEDCSRGHVDPIKWYCSNYLQIFRLSDHALVNSIDITPQVAAANAFSDVACNLSWSPDGRYISLEIGCNGASWSATRELYLVDLNTSQVTQFTDNISSLLGKLSEKDFPTYAFYETVWHDSQHLLFTSQFGYGWGTLGTQWAAYQPGQDRIINLSLHTADFLALNPETGEVAYRDIPSFNSDFQPQNTHVQIATFKDDALTPTFTGQTGCYLSWSPDGGTLAYMSSPTDFCGDAERDVVFVDDVTHTTRVFTAPEAIITPIGWVKPPQFN
jgi:Tol biopolymer transport system component